MSGLWLSGFIGRLITAMLWLLFGGQVGNLTWQATHTSMSLAQYIYQGAMTGFMFALAMGAMLAERRTP